MNAEQLANALDCPIRRAQKWWPFLDSAMASHGIDTVARQAAFLAQVGHESGRLQYVRELWNPTPAQTRYEGRKDLGNMVKGDGFRYRGRGLLQITGRTNYAALGKKMGLPLIAHPELLELPGNAADAAALFWQTHDINRFADAGDFDGVCDRVNIGRKTLAEGDSNGYAERLNLWRSLLDVMKEQSNG